MKLSVLGVVLLGILGCAKCIHHSTAESTTEAHKYVWSAGFRAGGNVGVKYKDGVKFVKDGSFDWYASTKSPKKATQQDTKDEDTNTVAAVGKSTTLKPFNTYNYDQGLYPDQYPYRPSPYGYNPQPYANNPIYGSNQFSPYDSRPDYGYIPREEPQRYGQNLGYMRVIAN